jgi:hypothetical protein
VKESTENDRLREAFTSLGQRARLMEGCPLPEAIWSAAAGDADDESLRRLIEHTTSCAACAEDWRVARAVGQASGAFRGLPRPRRLPLSWLAAAATVALAVGGGAYVFEWTRGQRSASTRGEGSDEIRSLLPENEPLSRHQCTLRWSAGPPGTKYDVRVVTEDAVEVAVAVGLGVNEYRVAEAKLRGLEPGARLLWRVRAVFPDGRSASSPTFISTLR